MGVLQDAAVLRTLDKHAQTQAELLAQLLVEQQRTNQLLTQLLAAQGGRQVVPQTTSWGQQ